MNIKKDLDFWYKYNKEKIKPYHIQRIKRTIKDIKDAVDYYPEPKQRPL